MYKDIWNVDCLASLLWTEHKINCGISGFEEGIKYVNAWSPKHIKAVKKMILDFTDVLGMKGAAARLVPKLQYFEQKQRRMDKALFRSVSTIVLHYIWGGLLWRGQDSYWSINKYFLKILKITVIFLPYKRHKSLSFERLCSHKRCFENVRADICVLVLWRLFLWPFALSQFR